jgi:hypothetical protein
MSIIERLRLRIQDSNLATDMAMAYSIRSTIFPPANLKSLESAEAKLGFSLPCLLRDIYTQVANGGFGPGYGLIGLDDGAHDDLDKSITDLYAIYKLGDPMDSFWHWSDRLVPICHLGCAIYSCIDCSQLSAPIMKFDPNQHEEGQPWDQAYSYQSSSLAEWIEQWLTHRVEKDAIAKIDIGRP